MNKLQRARARILIKNAFFGSLIMSTEMVPTQEIPTAATDGLKIYYNPEFIDELPGEQPAFVLIHEMSHIMLKHVLRQHGRDPEIWNQACDYRINWTAKETGFELWPNSLIDEKYKSWSEDQIYDDLIKNPPPKGGGGEGEPNGGQGGGMSRDIMPMPPMSPEAKAKMSQQINQKVAQAASMARMAGQMTSDLEKLVNDILEPKIPWQQYLREYMTRVCKDEESWSRRNRRFRVYLPARHSLKMGEITMVGDTSGSISDEEMCKYAAEVRAIADTIQPERIRLVWADTCVKGEQVFEAGELFDPKPVGGGGTDMRVPLEHVEQYDPVVSILFTDGYTPWPDDTSYPLIVCCTTDANVPIGQVVRI